MNWLIVLVHNFGFSIHNLENEWFLKSTQAYYICTLKKEICLISNAINILPPTLYHHHRLWACSQAAWCVCALINWGGDLLGEGCFKGFHIVPITKETTYFVCTWLWIELSFEVWCLNQEDCIMALRKKWGKQKRHKNTTILTNAI